VSTPVWQSSSQNRFWCIVAPSYPVYTGHKSQRTLKGDDDDDDDVGVKTHLVTTIFMIAVIRAYNLHCLVDDR
jgi:hypothetical protein